MTRAPAASTVVPLRVADARDRAQPGPTVEELVERARAGELAAWALLYRTHYAAVARHLCALVGSRSVAEDLTQETFARAMTALESFRGTSAFSTWLHGVALNVARNHWRSTARRERAQEQLEMAAATTELREGDLQRAHQRKLRVKVLFGVLEELSDSLREAFVLRYIEGLSAAETAERLGIEPGTVRVRAHRARGHVEKRLSALGWSSTEGGA